jgi:hypothetical protein
MKRSLQLSSTPRSIKYVDTQRQAWSHGITISNIIRHDPSLEEGYNVHNTVCNREILRFEGKKKLTADSCLISKTSSHLNIY